MFGPVHDGEDFCGKMLLVAGPVTARAGVKWLQKDNSFKFDGFCVNQSIGLAKQNLMTLLKMEAAFMKKTAPFLIFTLVFGLFLSGPAWAVEKPYWDNWKRDFGRGVKNVLSSPLEIPITIQDYHEKAGYPVVRHTTGFFDGTVKFVERAGSGLWDLITMWIPGDQEGLPPTPETLF